MIVIMVSSGCCHRADGIMLRLYLSYLFLCQMAVECKSHMCTCRLARLLRLSLLTHDNLRSIVKLKYGTSELAVYSSEDLMSREICNFHMRFKLVQRAAREGVTTFLEEKAVTLGKKEQMDEMFHEIGRA